MTLAEQLRKINQLTEFHEAHSRTAADEEEALLFRQTVVMLGMLRTRVTKSLMAEAG